MSSFSRKVNRNQLAKLTLNEAYKKMQIKPKRMYVVDLSDGERQVTIHAPGRNEFAAYLNSLPVIVKLGKFFEGVQSAQDGVMGLGGVEIDQATMEKFLPLIPLLSNITVDEFNSLEAPDMLAVILGYVSLLSPVKANPPQPPATDVKPEESLTTSQPISQAR